MRGEPPRVTRRVRSVRAMATRAVVVGCGAVVATGLVGCGQEVSGAEADKAAELSAAVAPLGVDVDPDVAASLYGTDGGAVCAEAGRPDVVAAEAAAAVSHRFTLRRTEADADTVAYLRAVVATYCPDELAPYERYVDGLAVDAEGS